MIRDVPSVIIHPLLFCAVAVVALLVAAPSAHAQDPMPEADCLASVKLSTVAGNYQEHYKDKLCGTHAKYVVKLWFAGIYLHTQGQPAGKEIMMATTPELAKDANWMKRSTVRTFAERLKGQQHIFRSYIKGTKTEGNYQADLETVDINITKVGDSGGGQKSVFVQSSGASSARPIYLTMKNVDGKKIYVVSRYSSIYSGVRAANSPF